MSLAGELEGVTRGVAFATAAIGAADVAADVAYSNASRSGPLSIVAVIASLYPVSTIALGMIALRERPPRIQLAGATLAGAGVAILAASTG
jgi:drug/metabolite transporter (DMT)-like permease